MSKSDLTGSAGGRLGWPLWRALLLASAGGALEFYDFILYGVFSLYIGRAFFPAASPLASLAYTFLVFAAGYAVRPIGGVVLSHFGDRFGRARIFVASLLAMSLSTIGIGLTPSYPAWGPASIVLVVLFRLVQGFCLGGEMPAAVTYAVETAPRRAGLVCGVLYACVNMGVALASALSLGLYAVLSPAQVGDFGWRVGFVIGGGLGLAGYWLRRSLEETPQFQHLPRPPRYPVREVMARHGPAVAVGAALLAAPAAFNALVFTHMSAYLAALLNYAPAEIAAAQNAAIATLALGLIGVGWLCDHVPRHLPLRAGAFLFMLLSYPFYVAVIHHSANIMLLFVLAAAVASLTNGAFASIVSDLFPTQVRFSGLALAINISFLLFGGAAPATATGAIAWTNQLAAPALLMTVCGLLSFAASFVSPRYGGHVDGGPLAMVSRSAPIRRRRPARLHAGVGLGSSAKLGG